MSVVIRLCRLPFWHVRVTIYDFVIINRASEVTKKATWQRLQAEVARCLDIKRFQKERSELALAHNL